MEKYLAALQNNVCAICSDSNDIGICLLSENEICAVEKFLPKIVDVVHSLQSENSEDYLSLLRKNICTHCRINEEDDYCYLREESNCAIDRYFPLIVETIQKVDKHV